MITIQIVTKNNKDTIEKCLQSLKTLNADIVVFDIGSTDKTIEICRKFGAKIEKRSLNNNYAQLRNQLLGKKWQMYLEPHEFLATGHEEINDITKSDLKNSFYFKIVQGTIISKEIRLWNNNNKFVNPCYETLKDKQGIDTEQCIICSNQDKIDLEQRLKIIEDWKITNPVSPDPYYYQALTLLLQGNYIEFINIANHYLFREKDGQASVMIRYYLAMVQAYQSDELNEAIQNILTCIGVQPLMAEFWCLLGDIHYKTKQYEKSICFYENALILGSQRLQSDRWPIDVSKYKEYPNKMIESADKIKAETKIYLPLKT